jgi:hypothetical protein
MGPRESRKSMWLHAVFTDAHLIDLLGENASQRLPRSLGLFADELRAIQPKMWVIIDEMQRSSRHCRP